MSQNTPPRKVPGTRTSSDERVPLNHAHEQILRYLQKVRFRKSLFGVSEPDVWRKLEELNDLYDAAISAERARYDALLAEQKKSGAAALAKYNELRDKYNALVRRVRASQTGQKSPGAGNGEEKQ